MEGNRQRYRHVYYSLGSIGMLYRYQVMLFLSKFGTEAICWTMQDVHDAIHYERMFFSIAEKFGLLRSRAH